MAIHSVNFVIEYEGADMGKVFRLTRMDAISADRWGRHVLQAAIKANKSMPKNVPDAGIGGLANASVEIFGYIDPQVCDGLIDRMMQCVSFVSDSGVVRPLAAGDIEEMETVSVIQAEVFKLHTGFFKGAVRSFFPLIAALAMEVRKS